MTNIQDIQMEKIWNDIEASSLKLNILMAGKTGVGKTSLVNAITGEEVGQVSKNGEPCTRMNSENILWKADSGDVCFMDVPGFGEANAPTIDGLNYDENVRRLGRKANVLLLVISCSDKALEKEEQFLMEWKKDSELSKVPVFIVINKIDSMKPIRE